MFSRFVVVLLSISIFLSSFPSTSAATKFEDRSTTDNSGDDGDVGNAASQISKSNRVHSSGAELLGADVKSKSANVVVDELVEDVSSKIQEKYDPLSLPDGGFGFEKKILLVTVKGEAKFYEGWLVGLSTLHRVGTSHVTRTEGVGRSTHVASTLGIGNLVGHYKAHAKFMNIGPSFEVTVTVPEITIEMALEQQLDMEGSTPVLTHFKILRVGSVDVKIKGSLGLLNWTLNKIVSFIANLVKKVIINRIDQPIRQLISDKLKEGSVSLVDV